MNRMSRNLDDFSLLDLFRMEVETQSAVLTTGLLDLEKQSDSAQSLTELMRAAHSLKGAARIIGRTAAVRVAHAMEECFVAAQKRSASLSSHLVDSLLSGVDLMNRIAEVSDETFESWEAGKRKEIDGFLESLTSLAAAVGNVSADLVPKADAPLHEPLVEAPAAPSPVVAPATEAFDKPSADRSLRVTAQNLNRLMGLAGEGILAARWPDTFSTDLIRVKSSVTQISAGMERLRESLAAASPEAHEPPAAIELRMRIANSQELLADRLVDLEEFGRRFVNFSTRLYHEVLDCRMRPFADGIQGFHRMVRDMARELGKKLRFEIKGEATLVDRDILEKLKAPLDHLLRNAIDHGIELPQQRLERGKPQEGTLELLASHSAGMLLIVLSDDGRGVDQEAVRAAIVRRSLASAEMAQKMSRTELLEFLFLPGFTMRESVSEISGRGVGLDVVQAMTREVGGRVRVTSQNSCGTRFQLELPLTLSVVRTLLVEVSGEPYAIPLARIGRAVKVPAAAIQSVQGREHFSLDDHPVGLVSAHQALGVEHTAAPAGEVSVVIIGDRPDTYGLAVDRFLGERELVVRTLDPRLGKISNISSAALMPDGSPVLIIDIDDLKRTIDNIASGEQQFRKISTAAETAATVRRKRVLVVDDSLTVRELERKLLVGRQYAVDVAVDGMDGWNAVRSGHYDLMITDIDMPRLDGIELLKLVRQDARLKLTPVVIVSYKDREEDRSRGLEAGADYYLTKASFHDETLVRAVQDLIGAATA
jgi:two-component system, chemotaxis family, sensor histidine kinase and response regulator WspE